MYYGVRAPIRQNRNGTTAIKILRMVDAAALVCRGVAHVVPIAVPIAVPLQCVRKYRFRCFVHEQDESKSDQ